LFTQKDLELMVQKWFSDGGDDRFRYSYNLTKDSMVFDVGAYLGNWAKKIYDIYHCKIYAFEPVQAFFHTASSDIRYSDIRWFNFGLGDKNIETEIVLSADGSSIFKQDGEREKIKIKCFSNVIKYLYVSTINVLKINIEGGEYDLLEHIIDNHLQTMIKDIQVQFHINVPDYEERRELIRNKLSNTHFLTYDYPFVWENWRII